MPRYSLENLIGSVEPSLQIVEKFHGKNARYLVKALLTAFGSSPGRDAKVVESVIRQLPPGEHFFRVSRPDRNLIERLKGTGKLPVLGWKSPSGTPHHLFIPKVLSDEHKYFGRLFPIHYFTYLYFPHPILAHIIQMSSQIHRSLGYIPEVAPQSNLKKIEQKDASDTYFARQLMEHILDITRWSSEKLFGRNDTISY